MPPIAKVLDDGQVPAAAAAIFRLDETRVVVRPEFLNFFNDGSVTETIIVYLKRVNGTSRKLRQIKLLPNESAEMFIDNSPTLESGDEIRAETTTASTVDFYVTGMVDDS